MNYRKYLVIGLLSLGILSTELFWTRLFSAEFFYTFAFLILSLAILGLGLGALFLKLFPRLNKPSLLPMWLTLSGFMIIFSVPCVFYINPDFTKLVSEWTQLLKLAAVIILPGLGYFFGGIALAQIFKTDDDQIPGLYMADLTGASIGVIAFVIVMNTWGAETTLLFSAFPILLAAFLSGRGKCKIPPTVVFISGILFLVLAGGIPELKRNEPAKVIYKHWDASAKIKIYDFDSTARGINIDNAANTPVYRTDGKSNEPDSLQAQFDIDVRELIKRFPKCRFLSLGSGGGADVVQALQYNAAEIHAVEVIPHINYLMREGMLKDFSGNIYNNPKVKVITGDARSYIRSFKNRFDIIYSLSSNTFAAFASGSFALAENYIFTKEAFIDYWNALSDSGFVSVEHQFYIPRLVGTLTDALNEMKIANPPAHFAVYDLPALRRKVLLVSKQPLDEKLIAAAYSNSNPGVLKTSRVLFPDNSGRKGNIINAIVKNGWRSVADTVKTDISPCTDDRPFIAQLGLLRNLDFGKLKALTPYEFAGFPISKLILLAILAVCVLIIIPFNMLPYFMKGEKLKPAGWIYFFLIGAAYMMIEVVLLQKYALFIGSTIHTPALVLTVLLVSSGIGSRCSGKFTPGRIFGFIVLWLALETFVFPHTFALFSQAGLTIKMIIAAIYIAPLGFFLGMPFPKAASGYPALVEWAFAVNGSAAVIGSVAVVMIASSFGYMTALSAAGFLYCMAYLASRFMTTNKAFNNY